METAARDGRPHHDGTSWVPWRPVALRLGLWYAVALSSLVFWPDQEAMTSVDLTSTVALAAYYTTASAGTGGIVAIALAMFAIRAWDRHHRGGIRSARIGALALALGVGVATTTVLNEQVLKPALMVPRPNVVLLAASTPNPLGVSPARFHALPDRTTRRALLARALDRHPASVVLHEAIRRHWTLATGYSLPSGHSLIAWFLAVFLLASRHSASVGWYSRLASLLLPWAVAVSYSRLILFVHTPLDIVSGAGLGILAALLVAALVRSTFPAIRPAVE